MVETERRGVVVEWFAKSEVAADSFVFLENLRGKLRSQVGEGFLHKGLVQSQFNIVEDELTRKKYWDPTTGPRLQKNVRLPEEYHTALAYRYCEGVRFLDSFAASKRMILVQLLDSIESAFSAGQLLVVMMLLRSVIEHTSVHYSTIEEVDRLLQEHREEETLLLAKIGNYLVVRILGTRLDWEEVSKNADKLFSKAKQRPSYKAKENRHDMTAEQILDDVDLLDRKGVKGIRAVYEVLSEFAHPNAGTFWCLASRTRVVKDSQNVQWLFRDLSLGAPESVIDGFAPVLEKAFIRVVDCLKHYDELESRVKQQREKIRLIGKKFTFEFCQKYRGDLDLYASCPCESGHKIKFCCGKR